MIGKYAIEIKNDDFIQGMTTSAETTDGGFSPETRNVSVTNTVGCISPTYASSGTQLSDVLIASCDSGGSIAVDKFLLGINSTAGAGTGGHIYYQAAGAFASYNSYSGNCGSLYSDMVSFLGDVYFTTDRDIGHIANTSATTGAVDSVWWTSTKSQTALGIGARHHLFVFNGIMFITDGNKIHSWDGTTIVTSRLALNIDQEIIDLGADLAQGRMLVSYAQSTNYTTPIKTFLQTKTYSYFVGSWDTTDPGKFIYPPVQVEDVVWAFMYFGGYQFVIYGNNFGYFTGSGIQFLRMLNGDQTVAVQVINKHKISALGNTLYMADVNQVLAYGNITKTSKTFRYEFAETLLSGSNAQILCLFRSSPTKLGLGYNDSAFNVKTFDITSANASVIDGNFYTLKYYFPKPILVRDIDIEYINSVAGGNEPGILTTYDEQGGVTDIIIKNVNSSTALFTIITENNTIPKLRRGQFRYSFQTTNPVRRILIRYDIAE